MSTNSRRKVDQGRWGLFIARAGNKVDICRESYFRRSSSRNARKGSDLASGTPELFWPPPLPRSACISSFESRGRGEMWVFIGSLIGYSFVTRDDKDSWKFSRVVINRGYASFHLRIEGIIFFLRKIRIFPFVNFSTIFGIKRVVVGVLIN